MFVPSDCWDLEGLELLLWLLGIQYYVRIQVPRLGVRRRVRFVVAILLHKSRYC